MISLDTVHIYLNKKLLFIMCALCPCIINSMLLKIHEQDLKSDTSSRTVKEFVSCKSNYIEIPYINICMMVK